MEKLERAYKNGDITKEKFVASTEGWFAYVMWGNTYNLRQKLTKNIERFLENTIPYAKRTFKKETQQKLF